MPPPASPDRSYRDRLVDRLLVGDLGSIGAVLIEGVKSCGKTATARRHAASEILLDRVPDAAQLVQVSPQVLLDGARPRLVDEWQRAPAVWDAVRRSVDDAPAPGQFLLTGSATPSDEVPRHSGAGRFAVRRMRPMALCETGHAEPVVSLRGLLAGAPQPSARGALCVEDYAERIVVGGWPQLLDADPGTAARFIDAYLDNLVEVDVSQVSAGRARNPHLVRRYLLAYAQLTAHPVPEAAIIRRASGTDDALSRTAATAYLDALRRLMVVDEVGAWNPTLRSRSRLTAYPKRHLVDPSLAAGLLRASPGRLLGDLETFGFLFESLVTRDLRTLASASGADVFHYREQSGRMEVDLVVEDREGAWIGVEVKVGGTHAVDRAAATLLQLHEDRLQRPAAALVVITAGEYCYRRPDGVYVVPLACLGP